MFDRNGDEAGKRFANAFQMYQVCIRYGPGTFELSLWAAVVLTLPHCVPERWQFAIPHLLAILLVAACVVTFWIAAVRNHLDPFFGPFYRTLAISWSVLAFGSLAVIAPAHLAITTWQAPRTVAVKCLLLLWFIGLIVALLPSETQTGLFAPEPPSRSS